MPAFAAAMARSARALPKGIARRARPAYCLHVDVANGSQGMFHQGRFALAFLASLCLAPMALAGGEEEGATMVDPADLFGQTWVAEDIDGRGVIDYAQSTIQFDGDGPVSGSTGCNRIVGSATIDGDAVRLGQLGTTRMACPEAVMDQESKYLDALGRVAHWRIERGLLFLLDADRKDILRFGPSG